MSDFNKFRRYFISAMGLFGAGVIAKRANAHHTETHFENESSHKLVYQCNKADPEYIDHVLFSCGEMLRKYGDDIELVIAVFGQGLHLLAKRPGRNISKLQQDRVTSLASYGVSFHACGNTMKALNWTEKDLLSIARVVPIGVDDLMLLQENNFKYVSW
jgi:intracellular sulfur oxidation DsrE/DsrF family protein